MAPLPTSCYSGQGEKLVMFAIRFCMDSLTIIKNLSQASGQFSLYILYGYIYTVNTVETLLVNN